MTNPTPDAEWSDKKIFTTGEAAQICKVSQQTIIRCFDSGRLHGFRVPGSKFRRIPREELLRFMRSNDIPTETLESGPKRILLVDDDENILDLLQDLLSGDEQYEIKTAGTGYDAGLLTESFQPHLIVLDYMLPDLNGNIVCERVRESARADEIRVLCVSGVVNQDEIDGLLTSGADAFVKKPFDVGQLLDAIEALLDGRTPAG